MTRACQEGTFVVVSYLKGGPPSDPAESIGMQNATEKPFGATMIVLEHVEQKGVGRPRS